MIGDHPVRGLGIAIRRNAGALHDSRDQRPEQVGLIIVMRALQHC